MPEQNHGNTTIPLLASGMVVSLSGIMLLGWQFNSAALDGWRVAPLASGLLLSGLTLGLLTRRHLPKRQPHIGTLLLPCLLLLLSGWISVQGWQVGVAPFAPALGFAGVGVALVLLRSPQPFWIQLAQSLVLIVSLMLVQSWVSFTYTVPAEPFPPETVLLMVAIVGLGILCIGLLFLYPQVGWMAPLTSDRQGGVLARRLLPTLLLPIGLGWLFIQSDQAADANPPVAMSLLVVLMTGSHGVSIWKSAQTLNRLDQQHQQSEHSCQQAEAALQASESRYRQLAECLEEGIWIRDPAAHYLYTNSSYERLWGLSKVALGSNAHWLDAVHPQDRQRVEQSFRQWIKQSLDQPSGKYCEEYRIIRPDGSLHWVQERGYAVSSTPGEVQYFCGIVRDITECRRVQVQHDGFFQLSLDLFCVAGFDGYFQRVNPAFETTLGFSASELCQQPFLEFVHPDDRAATIAAVEQLTTGQPVIHFENRYRCRDGSYRWIDWVSVPSLEEGVLFAVGHDVTRRKQLELELRASEARFRRLFDSNIIGIIFPDIHGHIFEANDAFLDMVGYTRAELEAGQVRWSDMTPPGYEQQDQQALAELAQMGVCRPFEKEYLRKDGSRVPVLLAGALLPNSSDRTIAFVLDLSERKQAETAVQQSEERYRSLVAATTSLVWTTDAEGRFVEPQPLWQDYTGQDWHAYHGYGWGDALHPDDRDHIEALWAQALTSRQLHKVEGRLWHAASQQYRYFEARAVPILNADGSVREWVGTLTDTHDRRQAESALRESEVRFRQMTDAAPMLVWMSGPDKRCTYFNQAWLEFTGRTMDQELGHGWAEGVHPDDFQRCLDFYSNAFDQRQPFEMEYRLRRFDGQYRWILDIGVPRFTAAGDFLGYIGSCVDIDDRKQAEATLEQRVKERTAQLEAANRELESFSYSVSHDLRAPLRHIAGFIELLQKRLQQTALDDTSQRYMTIIADTAKQAGVLIDDLLAFSRMGRSEMRQIEIDMNQLVQEVKRTLVIEPADRPIQWCIHPLPRVRGDPAMLRLVLQNLIENALKYTRSRSEAYIEIGCLSSCDSNSPSGLLDLLNSQEVFYVRDNGIGFNMQYAHKLFGVFQRLHSDPKYEGTGIGLANVRRIVHRHGGRTWAEGEIEAGATFYFSLPKLPVSVPPIQPPGWTESPRS